MSFLISKKPFCEFSPEEYTDFVRSMYSLRTKGRAKPASPAPGLSVNRTKKGTLSVRRSKARAFEYVTMREIAELAKALPASQADIWNMFKLKKYIIAKDRLEAERIYAETKEIPW